MNNSKLTIGVVIAILIAIGGYMFPQAQSLLGGYTRFPNSDLSAKTITSNGAFTSTGLITGAAGATLTTSNTATSTLSVGCIGTYATSTATAIRLVIGSIATSSTSYGGTNTIGLVGWQYGSCPA